uniref:Novel acetylcholine receptor chaperone n=1 Tax=Strigamia maritima TaxID=126957 RepID=T1JC91_STRMM
MASVVLKTLSILLGLFFLFVGAMKLTPHISKDMHKDIRKGFIQYAKVFPLSQTLGFKVSSKVYRKCVGWAEVCCGFTLIFIPGFLKQVANLILLLMMLGAVYTHYAIGEKFERTAPSIVFTFMLACRFIIYVQDWQKRKEGLQIITKEEKVD